MNVEQKSVTRRQVEEELERKSASIAGSISRIRNEFSLPTEPVKAAVRKHPVEVLVGTIAFGLACGWLVAGRWNGRSGKAADRPVHENLEATEFLHLVRSGKESGLSEQEAVGRALRAQASMSGNHQAPAYRPSLSERLGDHVIDMADAVVRSAIRVVTREAAAWLADAVRRDKPRSSQ